MGHANPSAGLDAPGIRALLALADFPRVFVKISGQSYGSARPYPHEDYRDLVQTIYDRFGPHRLLWGSDFPHVLLKSGYARALRLPERVYGFLSPADRAGLMGENAQRLYWDR
jgi:L-fuconolactonase